MSKGILIQGFLGVLVASLVACSGDDSTANNQGAKDSGTDSTSPTPTADATAPDTGSGGQDATADDASADSAPADAASDDGGDAGPACAVASAVPQISTTVIEAGTAPAQTGGAVTGGTYYLTAYTLYGANACGGHPVKGAIVVTSTTATTGKIASTFLDVRTSVATCSSETYETTGAHVVGEDGGVTDSTFTATATTISILTPGGAPCGDVLEVFTKQ